RISSGRIESSVICSSLLPWALWVSAVVWWWRSAGQLPSGVVETAGHRDVAHVVPDGHQHASEHGGVHDDVEVHGAGLLRGQRLLEPPLLLVTQVARGPDGGDEPLTVVRRDL